MNIMPLKPKLEVISVEDFEEIHRATMKLLKETGIVFRHDAVLALFKDHGAMVEGNLVRLPEKLVEDRIKRGRKPIARCGVPLRFRHLLEECCRLRVRPGIGPDRHLFSEQVALFIKGHNAETVSRYADSTDGLPVDA